MHKIPFETVNFEKSIQNVSTKAGEVHISKFSEQEDEHRSPKHVIHEPVMPRQIAEILSLGRAYLLSRFYTCYQSINKPDCAAWNMTAHGTNCVQGISDDIDMTMIIWITEVIILTMRWPAVIVC